MEISAIKTSEWLFPLALAVVVVVLGTVPYYYGYQLAEEDEVFMGLVGRGTPGAHGYLMFGKQVMDGHAFLENRLTPERLPSNYLNLEWWIWGNVGKGLGLDLMGTFHLFRVLTVLGFVFAVYFFIAQCAGSLFLRRVALALVCGGAGFGWVITWLNGLAPLNLQPLLDMKGVLIFGYLINKPHFIRAAIFAALTYGFLLKGMRTQQLRYFVFCGLAALGHSVIRPFHIPEFYLLLALFPLLIMLKEQVWEPKRWVGPALAGAIHLPGVFYYVWLSQTGALGISGWTPTPVHMMAYVFWLGVPGVVALLAFVVFPWVVSFRALHHSTLLLGAWILIAWLLNESYPYWKMGWEGGFYAMVMGTPILFITRVVPGVGSWLEEHPQWRNMVGVRQLVSLPRWGLVGLLCVVTLPGTAAVYKTFFDNLKVPSNHLFTYYIGQGLHDGLVWLDEKAETSEIILCSEPVGQFVPRLTECKVMAGHIMLTTQYEDKLSQVNRFYRNAGDDAFKKELLRRYKIRYVVFSEFEDRLGAMDPNGHDWIEPVYTKGNTTIYEVDGAVLE